MLQKPKNWIAETLWKPKKTHSLEQLRYLHYILQRNSVVSESNKSLLVETLRSIAEILIWGDQNDSTVFDFFLEKNMLLFFLKFMTQNCGNYVTVQLLQTLNILFENIKHETSLYFLLSNNHVNSIIVHKFDFSNEEVLAYYISFLKTLSLKLNMQTINFFFNEKKSDFPLYTEAIKFFHHPESMVRIAVRTLTLNVYNVGHQKMLEFICDKTATPYFSNLIWLIGKDAIELDDCVVQESDHFKFDKLKANTADHLDHLHYMNDILLLRIDVLNMILTDHMINRLLIPLYIYSLPSEEDLGKNNPERVCISKLVALFLLAQHMLIMCNKPLVNAIVDVIFNEDEIRSTAYQPATPDKEDRKSLLSTGSSSSRAFIPPPAPLESQLEACGVTRDTYNLNMKLKLLTSDKATKRNSTFYIMDDGTIKQRITPISRSEDGSDSQSDAESFSESYSDLADESLGQDDLLSLAQMADKQAAEGLSEGTTESENTTLSQNEAKSQPENIKIKEKVKKTSSGKDSTKEERKRPFIKAVLNSLDCSEGDGEAFYALCLLYSIITNKGLEMDLREQIGFTLPKEAADYNHTLMDRLLSFLEQGVRDGSKMRLVTFEMCILIVRILTIQDEVRRINDKHFAMVQSIREASTLQLRSFYKGDDLFVDTFEGQYHHMKAKPINVEYVTMDASLLLPPTVTPLTGIDFIKRLPCGDTERTQREEVIRRYTYLRIICYPQATYIFILMRELMLDLQNECEHHLPLSKILNPVHEAQVLDLNNSDLIACTIVQQGKQSARRFLVIDTNQFILVEPDTTKLGWGVVKFVCHLQDVEANPDKDDSRSLHIVIQQPFTRRSKSGFNPLPVMTAKFLFDDYIRCMSARQRLQKRRVALKHTKISTLATLLELPALAAPPSHYYSITTIDGSNSVWSPSSRGYSSTKNGSNSPSSSNLSTPSSGQKPKLLSPKHEEILSKRNNKNDNSDEKSIPLRAVRKTASVDGDISEKRSGESVEAESLAAILKASPPNEIYETTGRNSRTNTSTEVGEEIYEDTLAGHPSTILDNNSTTIERQSTEMSHPKISRSGLNRLGFKGKSPELGKKERSVSVSNNEFNTSSSTNSNEPTYTQSTSFAQSETGLNSSENQRKFYSAPGSPRGRRHRSEHTRSGDVDLLSKSLPAIAITSSIEERRQRAQRARAKAKNVKTRGGRSVKR